VVDLAGKVNRGAHMAVKNGICDMMGLEQEHDLPCLKQSGGVYFSAFFRLSRM